MYCKGQGVNQDSQKALYWFKKSAAQGNENAKKILKENY
jgi:TPR repeat protein